MEKSNILLKKPQYFTLLPHTMRFNMLIISVSSKANRIARSLVQRNVRDHSFKKLNTDIVVLNRKHHTATGHHMPYGIAQCYLPPGIGDFPA